MMPTGPIKKVLMMLPRKEFLDILTLMEKFKLLKIPQEPHIFQGIVPGLLRASKKMGFSEGLWTFMLTGLIGRCMEKQSKANCAFSHILRDFRSVKSLRSLLQIRTVPRLWEMCPPPILATFGFWIWQGWPATMPALGAQMSTFSTWNSLRILAHLKIFFKTGINWLLQSKV